METLHPLAVHLPLALLLIWPLVDAAGWLTKRPDVSLTALALLFLSIPSALFATVSGQAAYDVAIASGYAPERLDTHGDTGGLMPWLLLVAAVVRVLAPKRAGRRGHLFAILLGVGIGALAVNVGYTGGLLVYQHGVGVAKERAE